MNKQIQILTFLFICSLAGNPKIIAQDTAVFNIEFVTTNQSMWGGGSFSLDFDYSLFDESWNTGGGFDFTESICGQEFGIAMGAYSSGNMGINFYLDGLTTGTIDRVAYPIEVGFITPDPTTINAGQIIRIDSYFKVSGTPEIKTSYPSGGRLGLRFNFDMENSINLKGCAFSCAETSIPLNVSIDTALFQIGAKEGETFYPAMGTPDFIPEFFCGYQPPLQWPIIEQSDFLPVHIGGGGDDCGCCDSTYVCDSCDCVSSCPDVDCNDDGIPDNGSFALSDYFEGELDIPHIGEVQTTIFNTSTIQATGEDEFITASFDPIGAMLNFSPYKLSGDIDIPPPVNCLIGVDYNILTASIDLGIFNKQTFDFTADAFAILELPVKVDYQVRNQNNAVVTTGKDSIIEYKIGNYVEFRFPCDYEFIDFKPEIYLKNEFSNRTYNEYELSVNMEALELNVEFKKIVVVPEIEICVWLPVVGTECVTTPEVAYDPPDLHLPPGSDGAFWEETFPIGSIEQDMFNKSWVLDGFKSIKTNPFRIAPQRFVLDLQPEDIACNNAASGNVILNDAGGTHPLSYEWSDGSTARNLSNVKAGDYYVKVTDANKCEAFNGATINEPTPLQVTSELSNCLCFGDQTGEILLSVEGGVKPYSFVWSDGSTNKDLLGVSAGTYIYQVIDKNNCMYSDTLVITQPTELVGYVSNFDIPLCNGSTEGYIKYNVNGGTAPYRYQWSNFAVTQNIDSLVTGTYTVTVNDFNGCTIETTQVIEEPELLQVQLEIEPIHCYKGNNGAVQATISGGTEPYDITWYSPEFTLNNQSARIANLSQGLYQVEIYDSNKCFVKDSIIVTAPEQPFYSELTVTHPSCFENNNGAIETEVNNGTAPYSFNWSNGATNQSISGLTAEKYDVTISDAFDCLTQNNAVLIEPLAFVPNTQVKMVSCLEETDGEISIDPQGGTPPFDVLWSTNETGNQIKKLPQGDYSAVIVDAQNCYYYIDVEVPVNGVGCLDIPSAFTPNGDDFNDSWVIRSIKSFPNNKISVFTKWGELVFASSGEDEPWDGTHNGKNCPAATYYYVIDLGNGDPLYKGLVTIVR